MRKTSKAVLLFWSILLAILALAINRLLFLFLPGLRRRCACFIVHIFGKTCVRILGIKIRLAGNKELLGKKGVFFVCNHLSYIDGIVATSLSPLTFIGKAELKKWPFFGLLIFLSETIFVNRTTPAYIQKEMDNIISFLNSGANVILFPEGTSTNGEKLLPFKSSFFAAPLATHRPVVPLVLQYKAINSGPINDDNKDLVYWYGNMKFLPHLLKVLNLSSIDIEIKVCDGIDSREAEGPTSASQRKSLCEISRRAIETCLNS
jgi:1-acyl-sn-glycerol-3-phosphate acyltransferase